MRSEDEVICGLPVRTGFIILTLFWFPFVCDRSIIVLKIHKSRNCN